MSKKVLITILWVAFLTLGLGCSKRVDLSFMNTDDLEAYPTYHQTSTDIYSFRGGLSLNGLYRTDLKFDPKKLSSRTSLISLPEQNELKGLKDFRIKDDRLKNFSTPNSTEPILDFSNTFIPGKEIMAVLKPTGNINIVDRNSGKSAGTINFNPTRRGAKKVEARFLKGVKEEVLMLSYFDSHRVEAYRHRNNKLEKAWEYSTPMFDIIQYTELNDGNETFFVAISQKIELLLFNSSGLVDKFNFRKEGDLRTIFINSSESRKYLRVVFSENHKKKIHTHLNYIRIEQKKLKPIFSKIYSNSQPTFFHSTNQTFSDKFDLFTYNNNYSYFDFEDNKYIESKKTTSPLQILYFGGSYYSISSNKIDAIALNRVLTFKSFSFDKPLNFAKLNDFNSGGKVYANIILNGNLGPVAGFLNTNNFINLNKRTTLLLYTKSFRRIEFSPNANINPLKSQTARQTSSSEIMPLSLRSSGSNLFYMELEFSHILDGIYKIPVSARLLLKHLDSKKKENFVLFEEKTDGDIVTTLKKRFGKIQLSKNLYLLKNEECDKLVFLGFTGVNSIETCRNSPRLTHEFSKSEIYAERKHLRPTKFSDETTFSLVLTLKDRSIIKILDEKFSVLASHNFNDRVYWPILRDITFDKKPELIAKGNWLLYSIDITTGNLVTKEHIKNICWGGIPIETGSGEFAITGDNTISYYSSLGRHLWSADFKTDDANLHAGFFDTGPTRFIQSMANGALVFTNHYGRIVNTVKVSKAFDYWHPSLFTLIDPSKRVVVINDIFENRIRFYDGDESKFLGEISNLGNIGKWSQAYPIADKGKISILIATPTSIYFISS